MIAPLVLLGSKLRDRQTYKAVFIIWTHFEDVSAQLLSRVRLFMTPGTCQAPLSMGFSKKEYWSGFPCPPPGHLPHLGRELVSPALASGFFTTALCRKVYRKESDLPSNNKTCSSF